MRGRSGRGPHARTACQTGPARRLPHRAETKRLALPSRLNRLLLHLGARLAVTIIREVNARAAPSNRRCPSQRLDRQPVIGVHPLDGTLERLSDAGRCGPASFFSAFAARSFRDPQCIRYVRWLDGNTIRLAYCSAATMTSARPYNSLGSTRRPGSATTT